MNSGKNILVKVHKVDKYYIMRIRLNIIIIRIRLNIIKVSNIEYLTKAQFVTKIIYLIIVV